MKVILIKSKATKDQIVDMMLALESYIKLAVDIKQGCLAGGDIMHADCEAVLLNAGSHQENIWGADWYPEEKRVAFGSLINIRPRQNNRSMEIQDPKIRGHVEQIAGKLLEQCALFIL